jgi:hypothetical protein
VTKPFQSRSAARLEAGCNFTRPRLAAMQEAVCDPDLRIPAKRSKAMSEIEGRVKYMSDETKKKDFDMTDEEIEESDKAVADEEQAARDEKESLGDKVKDAVKAVKKDD